MREGCVVPILGRTPQECFDVFSEHVSQLVAATISDRHPIIPLQTEKQLLSLSFREQTAIAVPIETRDHGRLHFYLGQLLEAVDARDGYRLTTKQYWYRLQLEPELTAKAVLRWEYDSTTERDRHARHHTQIATSVDLGGTPLDFNKAHLPTGWVTFEEVIRFLIHDLGITPPCGADWPVKLEESERRFYEDFTGKRYRED